LKQNMATKNMVKIISLTITKKSDLSLTN